MNQAPSFLGGDSRLYGARAIAGHVHIDWRHVHATDGAHSDPAHEQQGPDRRRYRPILFHGASGHIPYTGQRGALRSFHGNLHRYR
jgi:hypothetical protein